MADENDFVEESIKQLHSQTSRGGFDERIFTEPLSSVSPPPPAIVEPQATIDHCVLLMQKRGVGCVLVASVGKLMGIFTERDVLTKVACNNLDTTQTLVQRVMTADPETLRLSDSIAYALNLMSIGGYRHIPLVDASTKPVGVVSSRDIMTHIVEFFPRSILNLPTQPRGNYARHREGA